jgi:hypothetical protein
VFRALIVLIAVALTACSFVNEQVSSRSTGACIRQECRDPDAKDYTRCEAACRERYQHQR